MHDHKSGLRISSLSAIAGALASCAAWFVGTLAIFASQGMTATDAASPLFLA